MLSLAFPRSRAVQRGIALAVALAGAAAPAVLPAGPARADHVRDQESWVLTAIGATEAWPQTEGQGATVAVIDSGVNPHVPDLAGSVLTGPDLTGVHTPPADTDWGTHGTWMAALVAGHGHGAGEADGIMGAAPRARILSIRVVTDTGDPGYRAYQNEPDTRVQQALARAIRYAAARHADVISMSLGYGAPSRPVRAALQDALDHGTVVVASAGNSGSRASSSRHGHAPYSFPADYPGVLGVGAVSQDGTTANFSSANLSVQAAAPGVMVPTQGRDGKYWYVNGTSPACALTAGVAALIKSKYPHLSPALVDQAITASAQNPPPGGYDDKVGFGTVNAPGALAMAARLLRAPGRGPGVRTRSHFGGGPAAVPAAPVRPRGRASLLWFGLLAVAFLALTLLSARAVARLNGSRRAPRAEWGDDPLLAGPAEEARMARTRFAPVPPPSRPPEDRPARERTAAAAGPATGPYPPGADHAWGDPADTGPGEWSQKGWQQDGWQQDGWQRDGWQPDGVHVAAWDTSGAHAGGWDQEGNGAHAGRWDQEGNGAHAGRWDQDGNVAHAGRWDGNVAHAGGWDGNGPHAGRWDHEDRHAGGWDTEDRGWDTEDDGARAAGWDDDGHAGDWDPDGQADAWPADGYHDDQPRRWQEGRQDPGGQRDGWPGPGRRYRPARGQ